MADVKRPKLFGEFQVYQQLHCDSSTIYKGIPNVYYFGFDEEKEHKVMVMDLLGTNLDDLFKKCNKKFSLKTVLMLADQMLTRMEFVHKNKFLHLGVKPANFVMGFGKNAHQLYLIDFGSSKKYLFEGGHIHYREMQPPSGNIYFISINSELWIRQSRRDDLESLGYLFIYFLKGSLPWENLKSTCMKNLRENIMNKKEISIEKLCEGLPDEFAKFLTYCRKLWFDSKPDYSYLKKLFQVLFKKSGFKFDYLYDWSEPNAVDTVKSEINKVSLKPTGEIRENKEMNNLSIQTPVENGNDDDSEWHLVTKKHKK